jgi:hypothetical protein
MNEGLEHRVSTEKPRCMGPCVRRDDELGLVNRRDDERKMLKRRDYD